METHYSYIVIGAVTTTVILAFGYFLMGGKPSSVSSVASASVPKDQSNGKVDGGKNAADRSKASSSSSGGSSKRTVVTGPEVNVYFGSQTGTAEGFARVLMKEGKSKGFNAKMVDLEDFDPEVLSKCGIVIFLMATYGEGEPTDNAAAFTKWLKSGDVEADFLSNVKFTVFGLGNRQYEHYNRMGKLTNELLEKIGGRRMFAYGEGDDDGSLEEDFENWKKALWPSLVSQFLGGGAGQQDQTAPAESGTTGVELEFETKILEGEGLPAKFLNRGRGYSEIGLVGGTSLSPMFEDIKVNSSTKHFFTSPVCTVTVNRQLRSGHVEGSAANELIGSTRHIELDVSKINLRYETADNLALLPRNDESNVLALAAALKYDLDNVFQLIPVEGAEFRPPFPSPCTIREALTLYFDIQGPPRHATVEALLPYVKDQSQKAWLVQLLSPERRHDFSEYVHANGKSLAELLSNELSSCEIPLSDFFHIAPYMQPRYYTISSSSSVHPRSIHITVSILESRLTCGKVVRGLCSSYLDGLTPGSRCRVFVRPSSFRLPANISVPIVMIGPGTGIAPMRALLQEREFQKRNHPGVPMGRNTLYFGCKHRNEDYIYSDELEKYEETGILNSLHLAFSRDSDKKVYVQHLLMRPENASALLRDIDEGGYIFVCGATNMGNDVFDVVVRIVQEGKGISREQALETVKSLQAVGRYVQELWSA